MAHKTFENTAKDFFALMDESVVIKNQLHAEKAGVQAWHQDESGSGSTKKLLEMVYTLYWFEERNGGTSHEPSTITVPDFTKLANS